jgi:hypothetical protein
LAASAICQYKNERYDFACDERTGDTGSKFCIFHDINYLKGDNYDKHKEAVVKRFKEKLAEYSSNQSTLFWLTQKDPTKDPSFSMFVGAYWILHLNPFYLERAFERSLADFLPLLSLPSNIQVGVIDYITKIVGGALTFGLLIIAFRRKFERKYTR